MPRGIVGALLWLLVATPSWADDFDAGLSAAQAGEHVRAVESWQRAAAKGDGRAQAMLGRAYENGHGVEKNLEEAARWYRLAAEQNVASAQYHLAAMLDEGRGVPQDPAQALTLYRKAAERGIPEAQYALGSRYATGRDIRQDDELAYMWLTLAVGATGSYSPGSGAREARDLVAERMDAAQIAQARELAEVWIPGAHQPKPHDLTGEPRSVAIYASRFSRAVHKDFEYPSLARRRGWEGAVQLRVLIGVDDSVQQVEVVNSSGHRILDDAAMEKVRRLRPLPARPASFKDRAFAIRVPIVFRLER